MGRQADRDSDKRGGAVLLPFVRREVAERPRPHGRPGHLRIAYLQPCPRLGGAERRAATAIPQLGRFGIDVVPVVGPTPLLCRWLEQQGVRGTILSRAYPAAWPVSRLPSLRAVPDFLRSLRRLAEQVEGIVRDGSIDLVVAGAPAAWVAASRVAMHLQVPVVWRADGSTTGLLGGAALRMWTRVARPNLVLHDCEAARVAAQAVAGIDGLVLPGGVDLDLFHPARGDARVFRPPGATAVVGFAGRLAPQARPEDFVRLAGSLSRRHPGIAFLMAGEGPSRARCEALARTLGIERALRFAGFVADMPSFYAACDVVIHTSYAPGCSSALLEPMAAERAVVAAEGPATLEVLTPGREGLLCPRGDVDAFTETVATLLELPRLRASLASAAGERMRRDFDARRCTARLAEVLQRLVTKRTASVASNAQFTSDSLLLSS